MEAFLYSFNSFLAGAGGVDFIVVHLEQGLDVAKHSWFVIDQQDVGRVARFVFPLLAAGAGGFSGKMKENLQPAPGSLSTQILPPMPWTRRLAIAKPKPIPSDCFSLCGSRKKSSNTSM